MWYLGPIELTQLRHTGSDACFQRSVRGATTFPCSGSVFKVSVQSSRLCMPCHAT